MFALSGCGESSTPLPRRTAETSIVASQGSDDLFGWAVHTFERLETEDSPESLVQVVERLNEWAANQPAEAEWSPDPLLETLPEALRKSPAASNVSELKFAASDAEHLQEALWLRAIARSAVADAETSLAKAQRLFDWTVRNIQLETDTDAKSKDSDKAPPVYPRTSHDVLLLGRGQAADRVWVFARLARQVGLDVVALTLAADVNSQPGKLWAAGALIDGQLYLFEPRLGLEIPGPDEKGVATLSQVLADEQLLRQLDLAPEHQYPVSSSDLKGVTASIEGTPASLSRRMRLLESRLPREQNLALTSHPTALAKRLKDVPQLAGVKLWTLPFERVVSQEILGNQLLPLRSAEMVSLSLRYPQLNEQTQMVEGLPRKVLKVDWIAALRRARGLQLLARTTGDKSAAHYFQMVRMSDTELQDVVSKLPGVTAEQRSHLLSHFRLAKCHASYWLGLMAFERANYPAASDYFEVRTLKSFPSGPWTHGAHYNLARTLEASDRQAEAVKEYNADADSPQHHGNALRARRLQTIKPDATVGNE